MGGGAAQHIALAAPDLVQKLILAGTRTSRKIFYCLAHAVTEEGFKQAWISSFFSPSPSGRAEGEASWARIQTRSHDRAPHLDPMLARRQTEAFAKFSVPDPGNPYKRIQELKVPVFVAIGDNDLLIPTVNSFEVAQLLKDAHLHVYPDSGHGFLYQYAEIFAKHVDLFLNDLA